MTVYCHLALAEIEDAICKQEQHGRACKGCAAPTRQCLLCHKVRGIADAERGLCQICSDKRRGALKAPAPEELTRQSIESKLDQETIFLRRIGFKKVVTSPAVRANSKKTRTQLRPIDSKPLLPKLAEILLSHAHLRGPNTSVVKKPLIFLMDEGRLMLTEAQTACEQLVAAAIVTGVPPWDELVFPCAVADTVAEDDEEEDEMLEDELMGNGPKRPRADELPSAQPKTAAAPSDVAPPPIAETATTPEPPTEQPPAETVEMLPEPTQIDPPAEIPTEPAPMASVSTDVAELLAPPADPPLEPPVPIEPTAQLSEPQPAPPTQTAQQVMEQLKPSHLRLVKRPKPPPLDQVVAPVKPKVKRPRRKPVQKKPLIDPFQTALEAAIAAFDQRIAQALPDRELLSPYIAHLRTHRASLADCLRAEKRLRAELAPKTGRGHKRRRKP